MGFWELLLLSVGLSMDAFAVALCKGLAMHRVSAPAALRCGLWFGLFQALMPVAGYFLGRLFAASIRAADHWVVFGLLNVIGINMLREALNADAEPADPGLHPKDMFPLALATSIDALAVGITLAVAGTVSVFRASAIIGLTTFLLSAAGAAAGGIFGRRFEKKAEALGGGILMLLGWRILLNHLGVLA